MTQTRTHDHLERIFRTPLRSFSLLNASCDFLAENCFIETKECWFLTENGYIATSKSTNMFNQRSLSNTSILNTKKRQHHHQPSSNQWKRSLIDNTTLTHRYTIYWFITPIDYSNCWSQLFSLRTKFCESLSRKQCFLHNNIVIICHYLVIICHKKRISIHKILYIFQESGFFSDI